MSANVKTLKKIILEVCSDFNICSFQSLRTLLQNTPVHSNLQPWCCLQLEQLWFPLAGAGLGISTSTGHTAMVVMRVQSGLKGLFQMLYHR